MCVCVSVCTPFFLTRPSDHSQIWHTYSDRYGTDSNLNKFDPPHPRGVPGGILESPNSKVQELSWTVQKINKKVTPAPPWGWGFKGSKFQKSGKFHELPRKLIDFFYPTPTQLVGGGRVQNWRETRWEGGMDGREGGMWWQLWSGCIGHGNGP